MDNFLGMFDFSGDGIMAKLRGNRTYLIVLALIVLNFFTADQPVSLEVLEESLTVGLAGTIRAGLSKVGLGSVEVPLLQNMIQSAIDQSKPARATGGKRS